MKSNKDKVMTYIIAIFSLLVSFVLIILAKSLESLSIDGTFELKQIFNESLTSVSFWLLNITIAISTALFWYWSFILRKTKLLSSEDFTKRVDTYNGYIKMKGKDFVEFLKQENKERRIAAYIEHIEKRIARREKKLSMMTGIGMFFKRDVYLNKRITYFKSKITPEYIAEHNVFWFYNVVSPSDFRYNSIYDSDLSDRTNSREGIKVGLTMAKKIIMSLAISTLTLSFITSLVLEFNLNVGFWITLLTVVLTLAMNFYIGNEFGIKIYNTEYLGVLDNRIQVLKKYFNTSKENLSEPTYADKILEAYENNTKVKEDLEKLLDKAEHK